MGSGNTTRFAVIMPAVPSQRYKLTLSYRGTRYHGWQTQGVFANRAGEVIGNGEPIPTVQSELARAVKSVVRHPINLVGSSRTDTGVHAKGQVAHFDTDQLQIPMEGMRRAINSALPDDIVVHAIEPVRDTFDAIRSTVSKRYQYAIWNALDRPAFFSDLVWHRWQELDIAAMRDAAAKLVGTHDFQSFSKTGHGRDSTVRTVFACDVSYRKPKLVIGVEGSGFLWNMVRIMVGTLVEIGQGRMKADQIDAMLTARSRAAAGPTAPPQGLYLQWIKLKAEDRGQKAEVVDARAG
jgi:tRNA pseudouridine38-40 synthase